MIEAVDPRTRGLGRRDDSLGLGVIVRRLDWMLLAAVGATLGYGLWSIAGITHDDIAGNPNYFLMRQAAYAVVGCIGMFALVLVNPDLYRRYWRVVYAALCAVMLLVLLAGAVSRHSRRWLDLGPFRFQPSEFGKLLLVLALAGFLADRGRRVTELRTVLETILLAAGPLLLVYAQPDLGTTLVYAAGLGAVLFTAGTRWSHLAGLGILLLAAVVAVLWLFPAVGFHPLKQYQLDRLTGFTHPTDDPSGATYNVQQSMTAVGSGGFHGRGAAGATQTSLSFLPEHNTDFAFAALGEQRGFVGCSILLLLYLFVVWRGLKVMAVARDSFGAIAAGGIVVALLFQIFVNVGMTMGIAPITGIPLPYVSVGGSSIIANLLAVGVLQAIYARGVGRR